MKRQLRLQSCVNNCGLYPTNEVFKAKRVVEQFRKKMIISEVYTIYIKYSGSNKIKYGAGGVGKSKFCINTFSWSPFSVSFDLNLVLVKEGRVRRD